MLSPKKSPRAEFCRQMKLKIANGDIGEAQRDPCTITRSRPEVWAKRERNNAKNPKGAYSLQTFFSTEAIFESGNTTFQYFEKRSAT